MSKAMETKFIGGVVTETKQVERNGVPIGIVEGYIATWDIDRGDWFGVKDQFTKGAFLASIMDHKQKNRQIRLKDHHGKTVGGFPIDSVHEDERGLFGIGEINLDVQQGREAFSLAKQGVLSDFSIGFSIDESNLDEQNELRTISKATIWEGSIVDEPMNPKANITAVKNMNKFNNIAIAPKEVEWNAIEAEKRVSKLNIDEAAKAFITLGTGFKSAQIADVIDGALMVIPDAVVKAAEYIKEGSYEKEIYDSAVNHLEKYFAKMNMKSPFEEEEKQFFNIEEVKAFNQRGLEKSLVKSGSFSREAAKYIVSKTSFEKIEEPEEDNSKELIKELNSLKELIQKNKN